MRREHANTGRRSEQRARLCQSSAKLAALPESARDEERAANTGWRSEQRAALPGSARECKG